MWYLLFSLFCLLLSPAVDSSTDQADVTALNTMFSGLNSASQLSGWSNNGGDPCGEGWTGIRCSGSQVTKIDLSGLGLTGGSLGYTLDKMTSVNYFDLSNNNIGEGNQFPYQLPPNLERLDFSGNTFSGDLPYSVSQMSALKYLNIGRNQLQGSLSDMFANLPHLSTIDLSYNNFSGHLPQSFGMLSGLKELDLQNNQFTGTIDVLAKLPLDHLNVDDNNFTGWIPDQLKNIKNLRSHGNSWNSEPPSPSKPSSTTPSHTPTHLGRKTNPVHAPSTDRGNNNSKAGVSAGVIVGVILSVLAVGAVLAFFLIRRKQKRSSGRERFESKRVFTPLSPVNEETSESTLAVHKSAEDDKDMLENYHNDAITESRKSVTICTTVYSVADLQMATGSFAADNLVGEGFVGRVYRAKFDDGRVLAVKKINISMHLQSEEEAEEKFRETVSNISRIHHPNVTELVGYCSEHGQHLLLYDFYENGSLQECLYLADDSNHVLSWNRRMRIALGTARGLEYLHEVCSPALVHMNFKSANILLDAKLNPHVSDCGLYSLVGNADHQAFNLDIGSGYTSPEVAMSGQYTLKTDVYNFGIVMLELLTGRKPFDSSRHRSQQSLVRWATPQLHAIDALDEMADPTLKGIYPAKSLSGFADVIALCLQSQPEFRPPMSEVVQALVQLEQRDNGYVR